MDTIVSMQTFRWVAELKSFVAASRRMDLSPAMTSKHIAHLEGKLGVRLLNRTSRKVSLTEAGSLYLSQIVETLDALNEAEAAITHQSVNPRGLLRISAPVWVASPPFVNIIARFNHQYPDVKLDMDLSGRFVDLVEEGYDLALRVSANPGDGYIARPLATIEFHWVASPDYLARSGKPADAEAMSDHALLWYDGVPRDVRYLTGAVEETQTHQRVHHGTRVGKRQIEPVLITANESLLLHAAIQGMGLCCLPHWLIADELANGKLEKLFDEAVAVVSLQAVYPSRKYLSSKVRTFIDFVQAADFTLS